MIKTNSSSNSFFPYTTEQLLSLADNEHFVRGSRNFALAHKWHCLCKSGPSFWGKFPYKENSFYTTVVQGESLQAYCSCSSNLDTCQHALALMLLFQEEPDVFEASADAPAELADLSKKVTGQPLASKPKLAEIQEGLALLETWMQDLLKVGLEQARSLPVVHWQDMANRLVDARLGFLAEDVRKWGQGARLDEWTDETLAKMGRLHLLYEGFKRFELLPKELQANLLLAVGRWPPETKDLTDVWSIVGRQKVQLSGRKVLRLWLLGEHSAKTALLEEVVQKPDKTNKNLLVGLKFKGELSFAKASFPLKARLKSFKNLHLAKDLNKHFCTPYTSINQVLQATALAKAKNPWLSLFPVHLSQVWVVAVDDKWFLQDKEGTVLALPPKLACRWHLRALSLEKDLSLFAEWDGELLTPLSVWAEGRLLDVGLLKGGNR